MMLTIIIEGKEYNLPAKEEEWSHLKSLAKEVERYVLYLKSTFPQTANDELLLMAALMLLDEKNNLKNKVQHQTAKQTPAINEDIFADYLTKITKRIENLAKKLKE